MKPAFRPLEPFPARQLEAFYYIALHNGISDAARARGVDQSTYSGHLLALEAQLGVKLAVRKPVFKLTPGGRILFDALERARALIHTAVDEITREPQHALRFVTSELIAQHYLPAVLAEIERRHPEVQCSAESGNEAQMRTLLRDGAVQFAVAPESDLWDDDCTRTPLVELPLVLLVPKASPVRAAGDLWSRPLLDDTLFVSAGTETLQRHFNDGLRGLQVQWPTRRQLSSVAGVATQVAAGLGFGLGVDVPTIVADSRIRVLPLPHFPPVTIAAFWRGRATPEIATAVELLRSIAHGLPRSATGEAKPETRDRKPVRNR